MTTETDSADDSEACSSSPGDESGDESEGSSSDAGEHSDALRGDGYSVGGEGSSIHAGEHSGASWGGGDSAGGDTEDDSMCSGGDDSEGSASDANGQKLPLYKETRQVHQTNVSNRLSLGSLVERLGNPHVTERTLVQYSLFRHATPTKQPNSRRFPPGSTARKMERALGHIKTIEWGVAGGKFRRH